MHHLAISSGSACLGLFGGIQISFVLEALGVKPRADQAHIRFGFGRFTTKQEVDVAVELIIKSVNELKI